MCTDDGEPSARVLACRGEPGTRSACGAGPARTRRADSRTAVPPSAPAAGSMRDCTAWRGRVVAPAGPGSAVCRLYHGSGMPYLRALHATSVSPATVGLRRGVVHAPLGLGPRQAEPEVPVGRGPVRARPRPDSPDRRERHTRHGARPMSATGADPPAISVGSRTPDAWMPASRLLIGVRRSGWRRSWPHPGRSAGISVGCQAHRRSRPRPPPGEPARSRG